MDCSSTNKHGKGEGLRTVFLGIAAGNLLASCSRTTKCNSADTGKFIIIAGTCTNSRSFVVAELLFKECQLGNVVELSQLDPRHILDSSRYPRDRPGYELLCLLLEQQRWKHRRAGLIDGVASWCLVV